MYHESIAYRFVIVLMRNVDVMTAVFEAQYPVRECLCLRFNPNLTIRTARLKVRNSGDSLATIRDSSRSNAALRQRTQRQQRRRVQGTYTVLPCEDETFIKKTEILSERRLTTEKPGLTPRTKTNENPQLWTPEESH